MHKLNSRSLSLALFAAAAVVASACGRPELIDRTRPNYMRKSDLTSGTWYLKSTVVDVPPNSAAAVVGFGGNMEKVHFVVMENILVAFRTYELMPGQEPMIDREKSTTGNVITIEGKRYRGAPVGAWTIESHFDRQRQYNAATGEQSNVLEENSADRPWFQREFMRVDWSRNVARNFLDGTMDINGVQLRSWVTPIDQQLAEDAFLTEYVDHGGQRQLRYFDFTVRMLVDPTTIDYPGYGKLPYCFLDPTLDCESTEVQMRTSVLRVDEERVKDYEPLAYNELLQKKFGFFRTERLAFDPNRGVTESTRILLANRHNIWQRAKKADGTVIPVEQRQVRPVTYHLPANFPADLMEGARGLEASWDKAFRRAVAVPRGLELDQVPQMFHVCTSPVKQGDPEACGVPGTNARLGDLRFNLMPFIEQPQGGMPGLLGLGPSDADPETGEIVHAVANLYGAGLDTWTNNALQIIDVINGELTIEQLVSGKNVTDYVFEHLNATDPRRPAEGPWTSQQPLKGEPTKPLGAYSRIAGNLKVQIDAAKRTGSLPVMRQDRRRVVEDIISKNPALEAELVGSQEIRKMVIASSPAGAFRSKLESDPAFYRTVARQVMTGTDPISQLRENRQKTMEKYHGGCMYEVDYSDPSYLGIAQEMAKVQQAKITELQATGVSAADAKKQAKDFIFHKLRNLGYRSIEEHEVGHTVGLRHNFVGSFDAMNFADGYWDLRKQTIGVNVGGQRVLPTAPQNLADAAKMNQAQIDGRMREYQYSSIMDYGARVNSQIVGIGKYDDAAILFAYSGGGQPGYVEVFNETRGKSAGEYASPTVSVPTDNPAHPMLIRGAHVEIPFAHVEHYTPVSPFYSDKFHYSTLPFHFADRGLPFGQALDQGIARMKSRSFRRWSEMAPVYSKIEGVFKQMQLDATAGGSDWNRSRSVIAQVGPVPVEVPYMFCSDEEVGANLACNRNDEGADVYEMTQDWMQRYNENYIFSNFRRDRINFQPNSVLGSKLGRYLDNLPNVYQQWLFNIFFIQSYYGLTSEQMEEFVYVGDPMVQNYMTMSVVDSTNMLLQQLSTPSAGYHGKLATGGAWVHLDENNAQNSRLLDANGRVGEREAKLIVDAKNSGRYTDVVYVPRGPGRSQYTLFDNSGFDSFTRIDEVGHFWDQLGALQALTTSTTNFLGVDRGSDALRYSLPYYMTFNKELASTFSSVWTSEKGSYSPQLVKTANGEATVVPPTFVKGEDYVFGFEYPVKPSVDPSSLVTPERVEPTTTWGTRFYAQVWGMAYFTDNFNLEFANYNQVYRIGSSEALTPEPGFSEERFDDPFGGGFTYAALVKVGDPDPPAAARLIRVAKTQHTKWTAALADTNKVADGRSAAQWEADVRESLRSLEMMRSLYNIFGKTTF
jgi:hypothetical protein